MTDERSAEGILRDRLARGDIDPAEFERRLAVLRQTPHRPKGTRPTLPIVAAALVLVAAVSVGAWAMSSNRPGRSTSACTAPSLPGSVVNVALTDMSGMMSGGGMRVIDQPVVVPAGEVSFRVANVGRLTHELVVMPLPPGGVGSRPIATDGRVDETGSLGEASRTCGAGAGEGIVPGAKGWVTLQLESGRYELLCNEPAHYGDGMHAVLAVQR